MAELRVVADELACTEAPRWRDGDLYFSDMHGRTVHVVSEGAVRAIVEVPGTPGGLGFLPDGTLLVVAQEERVVVALRDGEVVQHADLSAATTSPLNDMLVLPSGRAYVGEMGFDVHAWSAAMAGGREDGPAILPGRVHVVEADGSHKMAADGLLFPNGMALGAAGELLVAESFAFRITALELAADGAVIGSRRWAQLDFAPDGISPSSEGHLWVADPDGRRAVLVAEGGQVMQAVATEGRCLSVAWDGTARLALCTTEETDPHLSTEQLSSKVLLASLGG